LGERQQSKQTDKTNVKASTIRTTIDLPYDIWERFTIYSLRKYGARHRNDLLVDILNAYLAKHYHEIEANSGIGGKWHGTDDGNNDDVNTS